MWTSRSNLFPILAAIVFAGILALFYRNTDSSGNPLNEE